MSTESLDQLPEVIQSSSTALSKASTALRDCYSIKDDHPKFVDFRHRMYNEMAMYATEVYPDSIELIEKVNDILDNFVYMDNHDEFLSVADELLESAHKQRISATKLYKQHTFVLGNLDKLKKEMTSEVQSLQASGQDNLESGRQQIEFARDAVDNIPSASVSDDPGIMLGEAIGKLLVMGAYALIGYSGYKKAKKGLGLYIVAGNIEVLVEAVEVISEMVTVLTDFLHELSRNLSDVTRTGARARGSEFHWKRVKDKARKIIKSCEHYLATETDVRRAILSTEDSLDSTFELRWKRGLEEVS
jgi:hypothetical protein